VSARRAAAALIALGVLAAGCDTLEHLDRLHPRTGAPPIAPEILAAADTCTQWVGGPRVARGEPGAIGVLVLWNAFDPRCAGVVPMIEAWHEAYARWGLRITGLHFAPYPFAGDSAIVGAATRRLGVRFPTAIVSTPPPAAVMAGRGPVIVWPGGGDAEPQWLQTPGDANAFEARLRMKLRQIHPDAGFPSDGGVPRGAIAPGAARTLRLGTDRVEHGPLRGATPGRAQPFVTSFRSEQEGSLDTPVPVGWWTPQRDRLEAARGGAANFLAIRYDAGPAGAVMGPPGAPATDLGAPARVWILADDRWLTPADAGDDVKFDAHGGSYVDVGETRLYSIARGGSRVLKLSPDVPGIRFYALTFEAAPARP